MIRRPTDLRSETKEIEDWENVGGAQGYHVVVLSDRVDMLHHLSSFGRKINSSMAIPHHMPSLGATLHCAMTTKL